MGMCSSGEELIYSNIAVMRGAVMHGLDVNLIKHRVMRRSYGVISQPAFRQGRHPESLRFIDKAGVPRCKDVMQWFARKVLTVFYFVPNFPGNGNYK
jgi:hypothetical protein